MIVGAAKRIDGAVLAAEVFVLRYFGGPEGDRLLIVNLGSELELTPAPEPLLARGPAGRGVSPGAAKPSATAARAPPRSIMAGDLRLPGQCALFFTSARGECE